MTRFLKRLTPTTTLALMITIAFLFQMGYLGSGKLFLSHINSLDAQKIGATFGGGSPIRWFTSLFVHSSFKHYLSNMVSLIFVGKIFERLFGRRTLLRVFFGTGIGANMLTNHFLPNDITLGTSGAIFGLLGFVLAKFIIDRNQLGSSPLFKMVVAFAVLNIITTFVFPNINIVAHIGGLGLGILGYSIYSLF